MYSRLLKLILAVGALGWGVSVFGVLLPWPVAEDCLRGLGVGPLPADPMLDYWLRMAGGGFTMVGVLFAAILINPRKYGAVLPLLAWLCVAEGVVLLASGLRLGLPPFPFWGDVSFCLGVGLGLLVVHPRAAREQMNPTLPKENTP